MPTDPAPNTTENASTSSNAVPDDLDAIVIGGGHNGLVTAAYLARAGLRTAVFEARAAVGGTASSETFAGATVNICSCDHVTFRTTPIASELGLDRFGLEYDDLDPGAELTSWSAAKSISHYHDPEATLESIAAVAPADVDGYRRYVADASPVARIILDAANQVPTRANLARRAIGRRLAGMATLLRWSRRSAADVLRSYFSDDRLAGTGAVSGPMVWGVSPELPGTGLGALPLAMRHVAQLGRPRGGSGALPRALAAAFEHSGGTISLNSRVAAIECVGGSVRGVRLADGTEVHAPIVVSAVDPRRTFVEWLKNPPAEALGMIDRWRDRGYQEGYESKVDAIVDRVPVFRSVGHPTSTTMVVAPSLAEIDRGFHLMQAGAVLDRPAMLVNVPSLSDPSMIDNAADPTGAGHHVLSLEVLYTPYSLAGGWERSDEPERWIGLLAGLCEPGLEESIVDMRAMTPDVYERSFHLPAGHATSFAGGPLATFRSADPELTRYETAVGGLYLTGAATFPGAGVWGASGRNCAHVILASM